jgi:AAA+ ATPase superfamily predicted ATPase
VGAQKDQSKRGRYFLKDNFFRFYFRFIYRHMSEFQLGNYKELKRRVLDQWPDNRGRILEDICLEFVRERLSGEYLDLGRYWDRTGTEIEIVGMDKKARRMVAIEVKSRDLDARETDRILTKLSEKVINLRRDFDEIRFGVIARKVKNKAALRRKGILCWDFQDLFGRT